MLTCQECGHEVTKFEWKFNQNLCEHLMLDILARKQNRLRARLLVKTNVQLGVAA